PILLRAVNAHVRTVAVLLSEVQPVGYHDDIWDGESAVVGRYRADAARGLVEQRCDFQAPGLAPVQHVLEVVKSLSGVEDVLHNYYVQDLNAVVQYFRDLHIS